MNKGFLIGKIPSNSFLKVVSIYRKILKFSNFIFAFSYLQTMQDEFKKPLSIYSASAGSGKTFSLVQKYLRLTLGDFIEGKNFSKVLAMTFTNKAAWEMKDRIIQGLDQLAYPERETEIKTKKAKQLLDSTQETTGLSPKRIQEGAKHVLSEILHNYEEFNVLTIDKFSLRLIRTFSRDLDLDENFEVTLDQSTLLEQVVDELMSKIGQPNQDEITNLTLNYAKSNVNEGDQWNFRESLIQFSKVLTNETDQVYVKELLEKEFSEAGFKDIEALLRNLAQEHREKCDEIYQYFISLGTTIDDYPSKSKGIYPKLEQLPARDLRNMNPPSSTIEKTLSGESVKDQHNVDGKLIEMVRDLFNWEEEISDKVFTLNKIRSNYYNLALLKYISKELKDYQEREKLIGIHEFGQMIADLLSKENTMYIYERLGSRYKHYLLDEFQDTSRLQWLNLIPLVEESISGMNENLIVGDPKQAIYRFRNGLVEQFVELPGIYNPDGDEKLRSISAYFEQMGDKIALKKNFRSRKNIVQFNNSFFKQLLEHLPESFREYYEDIHQEPVSMDGGFVDISWIKEKTSKEDVEVKEEQYLLENIKKCINDGYRPGDICILTRNKKEGTRYANILTENNYTIVSSDSLVISSDAVVGLCIDYLNLRKNTTNKTLQMKLAASFYRIKGQEPIELLNAFWKTNEKGNAFFDFGLFIEKEFESSETFFFPYENLYDLGKQFLSLINKSELNNPYLHHLMELFQRYEMRNGPDIRGFIEEWENKLKRSTIQMPQNSLAIQIMTIHKSKGLEFPIVIMPNLSFKIKPSRNNQFIELEDGQLLYSTLKKEEVPEYMYALYQKEYEQLLLDDLNVLYVAFTRPVERLYVMLETTQPSDSRFYTQMNQPVAIVMKEWKDELSVKRTEYSLKIGEETKNRESNKEQDNENEFSPKDLRDYLWFPELALQDAEALEKEDFNEEQKMGKQLHLLLSKTEKDSAIDDVIDQLIGQGEIEPKWKNTFKETVTDVNSLLETQAFVKTAESILNEKDILISEKETKRPDRIYIAQQKATIIDFKTGAPLKKHQVQVREYCKQIYDMGYDEIEGYLLYTNTMQLEKVQR